MEIKGISQKNMFCMKYVYRKKNEHIRIFIACYCTFHEYLYNIPEYGECGYHDNEGENKGTYRVGSFPFWLKLPMTGLVLQKKLLIAVIHFTINICFYNRNKVLWLGHLIAWSFFSVGYCNKAKTHCLKYSWMHVSPATTKKVSLPDRRTEARQSDPHMCRYASKATQKFFVQNDNTTVLYFGFSGIRGNINKFNLGLTSKRIQNNPDGALKLQKFRIKHEN